MQHRLIVIFLLATLWVTIFPTGVFAVEKTLPSGIPDSKIGNQIDEYIKEHKDTTAAVSIAVFREQETIYQTKYGYANWESNVVVNDETVYEWGSVSKLLVWVSVMQLWEQGRISLDADVKEYLPEGFFTKLQYDKPITVKHLMNHNAGWEDVVFQMCAVDVESILPLGEALKVTEPRQVYSPGSVCAYSNWGTALAGYIVELISGQPFYEYVQEYIFKPLGMEHSSSSPLYSDNPWVKSKLLENKGYAPDLTPLGDVPMLVNVYPAGSAAGTLDDFLTFAKALVLKSNGSKQLFKRSETHEKMFSPTLTYPGTDIEYVNHGFWSHEFNVQTLGHGGNTVLYSSYLMIDPVSGVGFVVMTNQGGEMVYNYGLAPMIFGELGQMAVESGREDTSQAFGLYYSARTIRQGIGKMYTVLGLRLYLGDGNDGFDASLFGLLKITGKQIAPNTFIVSQKAGAMTMETLDRFSNNAKTKKLSSLYGEALEADNNVKMMILALVLYAISVLWSFITLISSFIRILLQKLKRKQRVHDSFKKYQLILCVAILLPIVIISAVAKMMFSMNALTNDLIPYIIANIVLSLIPFVYAILLFKNRKKLLCSKAQKVIYYGTMVIGFMMTFTIFAFELYKV